MKVLHNKKYLYLPLRILLIFNLTTIFLFVFGPIDWNLKNEWIVVSYLLINLTFLYFGYTVGIKYYKKNQKTELFEKNKKTIYIILFLGLFWFLPTVYLRLGGTNFDLNEIFERMSGSFLNSAIGYNKKNENFEIGNNSVLQFFDFFFSTFNYALFPISILYFKKLNKLIKIIIIAIFLIECLSWIIIGTNKGIIDMFLIFFLVGCVVDPQLFNFNIKKLLILILSISLILFFFFTAVLSRFGVIENTDILNNLDLNVLGNPLKNSSIYLDMNIGVKFAIMQFTSYLTQGYYNLGVALNEPFIWTYGFGNSWMGIFIWERFTGDNLLANTYLGQMEKNHGIDPKIAWHSIYTWLASDFTFFGVPIFIFFVGYFFARSWLDTIFKRTIFSIIVFCLLGQMIFYFFANNQIFSFSFVPLCVFFTIWCINRQNFNLK